MDEYKSIITKILKDKMLIGHSIDIDLSHLDLDKETL